MIGAIAGDIIGSVYEHNRIKTKDFPLFNGFSRYTDDSVITLAVAEALLRSYPEDNQFTIAVNVAESMHRWGRIYPNIGYGGMFQKWLFSDDPKPYNSLGNGSAMRVSSVAWIYRDDFEKMRGIARATALPTHNHPEGIKGADAVASCIWLALEGRSKEAIKEFVEKEYGYNLNRSLDEIRTNYTMDATCPGSVPEAITAFLEGNDYEDVIRNAVSLGGDSDTIAAMAGGIAEAFYGIPEKIVDETRSRLTPEQNIIVDIFDMFKRGERKKALNMINDVQNWVALSLNRNIEKNIEYYKDTRHDLILGAIYSNIEWGKFYVVGEFEGPDYKDWIASVTGADHLQKDNPYEGHFIPIKDILQTALEEPRIGAILLNPWTQPFVLSKEMIQDLLQA